MVPDPGLLQELRRLNANIEMLTGVLANPDRTTRDAQDLRQALWARAKSALERAQ